MNPFFDDVPEQENEEKKEYPIIPNNTKAVALIEKVEIREYEGSPLFSLTWRILEGGFKNRCIFHNLYVFSDSKDRKNKSINMLKNIFILSGKPLPTNNPPTEQDLQVLKSVPLTINIREWYKDNKSINWIDKVELSGAKPAPGAQFDDFEDVEF